ncbi:uncharacterized protein TRUGW13939_08905 [Talaromyces rugulosus]|uniref:Methyltransferase type 12 domain-containing protein n=1 Tax=Talaromyces rugulosus TaxID=121627 RepID=A0A7H8R5U2_TALRU|nr:uncharacterized protein TRUGW13939_08905 [Talaromyces rugulosus]QKX61749.1 hypothetical protein TRUGW13939_08905 [Talaromyces rugulosus]
MSKEDNYPLTRGSISWTRINLLQYVWRDTLGYLIHPEISRQVRDIADIATGTGLWLCEIGNDNSYRNLHGYDISADSFIDANNLPPGVQLRAVDASKPAPEELKGQYDVVHIRLLQSVVHNDDPTWIIDHSIELLRPGGYLQWEEFDPLQVDLHENGQAPNLAKLVEKLETRVPGSWVSNLPATLQRYNMNIIAVDRKREVPWHHKTVTHLCCMVFEEYASMFLDKAGPPGSGDEMRALVSAAYEEAQRGAYASHLFQTVVAQKTK